MTSTRTARRSDGSRDRFTRPSFSSRRIATVVVGVRTRSWAARSVIRIGPFSSSVNRIDSWASVRSPVGAAVGVAAAKDGEQLGEDALQLGRQLVDLRFGLHHSSLV